MKNLYNFIILICVIILCSTNIFAEHIGNAVYGIISETYSGVATDGTGGNDNVTYTGGEWSTDCIEGQYSMAIGTSGEIRVTFGTMTNMTTYNSGYLYFSAKVPTTVNTADKDNYIGVISHSNNRLKSLQFNSANIHRVDETGTGIHNDNNWHTYYVLISDIKIHKPESVTSIFVVHSTANNSTVLVDNVYWTLPSDPSQEDAFTATIKNISDNVEASSITWSQSCFMKNWMASEQYVELGLYQKSPNMNWHVKTYLRNGKSSRVGLYYVDTEGTDHILPMAWRISADTLPNSSGDTLQIAVSGDGGLYDVGKYPSGTDKYA